MEGLKPEGQERSFKMAPGELLEERYLMGVSTASLGVPRLLAICSRMGMPAASLAQMQAHLPEANTVHFGYEQGAHAMVFKVYLEFWNRLNLARKGRAPGAALPQLPPLLLHLAWKWNIETPGAAIVSEYRIFPELPVAGIFERLGKLYPAEGHPPSLEAAERIVNLGARRTRTNFMYLEVTEPGNPRVSFDIRLYATELRVADVHPWLLAASRSFYIETQRFDALFKRVRMRALGHLSGGIDRAGRDFLTVYYPIE
jgi:tryptophan halogenase